MKTFEIITETDARVLERGETVMLARAATSRRSRRTRCRSGASRSFTKGRSADDASLAPPPTSGRSRSRSDHTGIALRRLLVAFLRGRGLAVNDLGTDGTEPVDYPDMAASVAGAVARGEADAGIVIDGAGIGSAIAANKIDGHPRGDGDDRDDRALFARAQRRQRADARRDAGDGRRGAAIVTTWLATPMREPRYIRRLAKIRDLGATRSPTETR